MVVCEPGVYSLRTGAGPLGNDPDCGSSHCELLTQDNLATLVVVSSHPRLCASLAPCHPCTTASRAQGLRDVFTDP